MKPFVTIAAVILGLAALCPPVVYGQFTLGLPGPSANVPHTTGTAHVVVQALGGGPARGATVSFVAYGVGGQQASAQTDANGMATVTLPAGPTIYNITASGQGGSAAATTVVSPGLTTSLGLALHNGDDGYWYYYGWGWRHMVYGGFAHRIFGFDHFLFHMLQAMRFEHNELMAARHELGETRQAAIRLKHNTNNGEEKPSVPEKNKAVHAEDHHVELHSHDAAH